MEKLARAFYFIFTIGVAASSAWAASPCDGVDRSLTNKRKVALAPEIARQLDASSVDVLQSFRTGDWSIIYVDSHKADEAFLFSAHDPLTHHYITLWSGAAAYNEEKETEEWVL